MPGTDRRDFLKKTIAASAGALALSIEEQVLLASQNGKKQVSGASNKLPFGKIGKVEISRLICGGNLINGYAHSRDLTYVSDLLKNYFTPEKVFETWQICEENGINTMVLDGRDEKAINLYKRYRKEWGGQMQFISQMIPYEDDFAAAAEMAVEQGAVGGFLMGGLGDQWVKEKKLDLIAKTVESIKRAGLIAGVAGHSRHVPAECEKGGIDVDFYVKTLHSDKYFSATPKEKRLEWNVDSHSGTDHDNMWCIKPEETIEIMKKIDKPWIAYKVMAAGAIGPTEAFKFAYENGADFILAGMFDFQVIEDVVIAKRTLEGNLKRQRPWRA